MRGPRFPQLAGGLKADAVFANHDYEPAQPIERDGSVKQNADRAGIAFVTCKDQVIFEKDEVLTQDGRPFSVFTPYKNAWLKRLDGHACKSYAVEKYIRSPCPLRDWTDADACRSRIRADEAAAHWKSPGMTGATRLFAEFKQRMADTMSGVITLRCAGHLVSVHLWFGTIFGFARSRAKHGRLQIVARRCGSRS